MSRLCSSCIHPLVMNSIIGQHHQDMAARTMQVAAEKKPRPQPDESLKCPRCDSTNTKFCYYNNYSLSQPRYFCKSCRRYWTKGGTLRNVPVGGGCRRSRRSVTSSSSRIRTHDHDPISPFAPVAYESPDFAPFMHKLISGHETYYDIPYPIAPHDRNLPSSAGFLDAIKGGFGFLENNQCDASGSYHGFGVRTTAAAEGIYDDGGCEVNFGGEGENSNRVLLGFPWQVNGGDGNCVNLVDVVNSSGRGGWNYGNGISTSSSTWYNEIVNHHPLM